MKCGARLVRNKRGKIIRSLSPYVLAIWGAELTTPIARFSLLTKGHVLANATIGDLEVCDGDVVIKVSAEDEPDYHGGHYSVFAVSLSCNKCGNNDFPELPQTETAISELLTQYVDGITPEQRQERIAIKIAEQQAFNDRVAEQTNKISKLSVLQRVADKFNKKPSGGKAI